MEHPYVESQVQDSKTIENKKRKWWIFVDLYKKFNEVNDVVTQQKKDNEVIDLVDDIMDYDNPFEGTFKDELEDIFIDDNLFDDFDQNDKKDIKMVCDDILKDENLNQNDVLFEELPKRSLKRQIIRPNKKYLFHRVLNMPW